MEHGGAKTSINLDAESEKAGHIETASALDGAGVIQGGILPVPDAGVKLNITRQSPGQMNPAASEISRYTISQFPYRLFHAPTKSIKTADYCFPAL